MRRMRGVVVDAVNHGPTRAQMIRNVFDIGRTESAGRKIEIRHLDADPAVFAEKVRRRQQFTRIVLDLAGGALLPRLTGELVPRLPGFGPRRIERPVYSLEPSARQLPLRQIGGDFALG